MVRCLAEMPWDAPFRAEARNDLLTDLTDSETDHVIWKGSPQAHIIVVPERCCYDADTSNAAVQYRVGSTATNGIQNSDLKTVKNTIYSALCHPSVFNQEHMRGARVGSTFEGDRELGSADAWNYHHIMSMASALHDLKKSSEDRTQVNRLMLAHRNALDSLRASLGPGVSVPSQWRTIVVGIPYPHLSTTEAVGTGATEITAAEAGPAESEQMPEGWSLAPSHSIETSPLTRFTHTPSMWSENEYYDAPEQAEDAWGQAQATGRSPVSVIYVSESSVAFEAGDCIIHGDSRLDVGF